MEENKTPTGIKILGILHIIGGIPLIVFFGLGLYFIALGWGLLKVKPWARTVTMATYLILLVITLFFLPESILVVIVSVIILLYLNTYNVKFAFGVELSSREDRLIARKKHKYKQIIERLESRQEIYATESNQLGKAYFSLGRINIFENDKPSAFNNYKKARKLNYSLDKHAIILLGNCYAREGNKTKEAIETYIEYIRFRTPQVDENSKRGTI